MKNGYPELFINAHFGKMNCHKKDDESDDGKKPSVFRIPFRGDAAAELFRRKVERTLKLNCKDSNVRMIFTSRPLISTQTKDRLTLMSTPNVVYRFTCGTCSKQYIGLTERHLDDRVREHIPK